MLDRGDGEVHVAGAEVDGADDVAVVADELRMWVGMELAWVVDVVEGLELRVEVESLLGLEVVEADAPGAAAVPFADAVVEGGELVVGGDGGMGGLHGDELSLLAGLEVVVVDAVGAEVEALAVLAPVLVGGVVGVDRRDHGALAVGLEQPEPLVDAVDELALEVFPGAEGEVVAEGMDLAVVDEEVGLALRGSGSQWGR